MDLWVKADCPRGIWLDLTGEGLGPPFDSIIFACDPGQGGSIAHLRITVPLLLGASAGAVLGDPVPEGSTGLLGDATHYYVLEGGENPYNVIWQNGIYVKSRVDNCSATPPSQTYTLSADPDLAGEGHVELHKPGGKGKNRRGSVKIDDVEAHLDLTVIVTPCP